MDTYATEREIIRTAVEDRRLTPEEATDLMPQPGMAPRLVELLMQQVPQG